MRDELLRVLCNDVSVAKVPIGYAVGTSFRRDDGDKITFYVIEENEGIRLEDDGLSISHLEAAGVDLETDTRRKALDRLLSAAGAYLDHDDMTVKTGPFRREELAARAVDFCSLMIRMWDFLLLTPEKIVSTFREDASAKIRAILEDQAVIRENEPVNERLSEVMPDMVVHAQNRPPVAIFFANTDNRVHDAIFQFYAAQDVHEPLSVVALLEQDNSVSSALRRRATNRLATVPVFRQDEEAAVKRIAREVLGLAYG